ncbi:MAG: Maf family protein [Rhizomicrobium sp.]
MTQFVLASASGVRANLLSGAAVDFEVVAAAIDEQSYRVRWLRDDGEPAALAPALAREKAVAVAALRPRQHILGCDQVLLLDTEPIGKCSTKTEARALLARLRGRTHELVTAAALVVDNHLLWEHTEICRLTMRNFSDAFLDAYVSMAGDALTCCVGCYRLESCGIQLFERVEGDFFSILGLPLLPVLGELRRLGLAQS